MMPKIPDGSFAKKLFSLYLSYLPIEKFKYEFNGDNVFKAYADEYTQRGKQAALDVQGQAAALTGGYGSSWATSAACSSPKYCWQNCRRKVSVE